MYYDDCCSKAFTWAKAADIFVARGVFCPCGVGWGAVFSSLLMRSRISRGTGKAAKISALMPHTASNFSSAFLSEANKPLSQDI